MPIFKRTDGDLIKRVHPVRRMMPFLMPTRDEAIIFHEQNWKVGRALEWLKEFNATHPGEPPATLWHMFLWGCAKALHERPGLNRFVSGGHIYQRRGVYLSFAAKLSKRDEAPFVTVKKEFPEGEGFIDCVRRLQAAIGEGRSGRPRKIDKEANFFARMPNWMLRLAIRGARILDRFNLLPQSLIDPDPMYTSIFAANLGSVGIDNTFHHLYEHGTASLFLVLGPPRKQVVVGEDGQPAVAEMVQMRAAFDERVNDGHYCAASMRITQEVIERPDEIIGAPAAVVGTARPPAPANGANGTTAARA
jgi:hypothetical protein